MFSTELVIDKFHDILQCFLFLFLTLCMKRFGKARIKFQNILKVLFLIFQNVLSNMTPMGKTLQIMLYLQHEILTDTVIVLVKDESVGTVASVTFKFIPTHT